MNTGAHAHAQPSRASAPIGRHLRDARARTAATQCDQREEIVTIQSERHGERTVVTPRDECRTQNRRGMTRSELLALPVTVDIGTAARALGLGRSTGYELARRGEFPCRVLRVGSSYRVPTADLRRVLGVTPEDRDSASPVE